MPQQPLPAPAARLQPQELIHPIIAGSPTPPNLPAQLIPDMMQRMREGAETGEKLIAARQKAYDAANTAALSKLVQTHTQEIMKEVAEIRRRTTLPPTLANGQRNPEWLDKETAAEKERMLIGNLGLTVGEGGGPGMNTGVYTGRVYEGNPAQINVPPPSGQPADQGGDQSKGINTGPTNQEEETPLEKHRRQVAPKTTLFQQTNPDQLLASGYGGMLPPANFLPSQAPANNWPQPADFLNQGATYG